VAALLLTGCSGDGGSEPRTPGAPGASPTDSLDPLPVEIPDGLRPYYEQELSWRDCGVPGFQCATLTAPLDYGDIDPADDLQLAVARVRAKDQSERIGSLLVNPGGPGASAIDYLQGYAGLGFPAPVRERYDMVALDARGTGRSEPVECLTDAEMDAFTLVDRTPDDEAEAEELVAAFTAFGESCLRRSGRLLEHISTEDSARDLDLLRAVLGDERLHYYGASYGTQLGAVYAGLYPTRVGRLVLDAAVDPRLSTLERDREQAGGFETAFEAFLADCVAQGGCPLTEAGDLTRLFAELDERPLPTGEERPLTESLALTGVAGALYSAQLWPQLRNALDAAQDGDGAPLLALADRYHDREPDGAYGTIMYAFPAISCLDAPAALEDPDAVRAELGVTVNDVVLAVASKGFRDLLDSRGEPVEDRTLRTLVPVSVRRPGERGVYNNRVSAVVASLPVDLADPMERLDAVRSQMDGLKESKQAVAGDVLTSLSGFAPPLLLALGSRLMIRAPQLSIHTGTTNVPGPQHPVQTLGCRLLESFPYVPLIGQVRIVVAIFSYDGGLYFGVTGDAETASDIDVLTAGVERGMSELVGLVPAPTEANRSRTKAAKPQKPQATAGPTERRA
jgi:pimeloyl-ACP methyl ester carboxylesterase